MGGWTKTRITRPGFIADPGSMKLGTGRQWDFSGVPSSYDGTDGNAVIPAGTAYAEKLSDGKMVPRSASKTLASVLVASNVATATKVAHGYAVGEKIFISGSNLSYVNGEKTVASVPTADTFTFVATGADATSTGTILSFRRAVGLCSTQAVENSKTDALTGHGTLVGGVVFENLLPDATGTPATLSAQIKAELLAAGCTFYYESYQDTRAE